MTLPPRPPLPPSGPPRGTYFSRRKLKAPAPPSPPLTKILTRSVNTAWPARADPGGPGAGWPGGGGEGAFLAPGPGRPKGANAVARGEERVIAPHADVGPGE